MRKITTPPQCHPERKYFSSGLCKPCYDKQHRLKHSKKYKLTDRKKHLRTKYNLTPEQVDVMKTKQASKCAICFRETALDIDHNHSTNQIRALLCRRCNRVIGMMCEDPFIVRRAAEYLDFYNGPKQDSHQGTSVDLRRRA